jgi:hypothetical protein
MGDGLHLAGLDVELPVPEQDGAEGTNPGLVALHRRQIVGACRQQELIDLVQAFAHGVLLLSFDWGRRRARFPAGAEFMIPFSGGKINPSAAAKTTGGRPWGAFFCGKSRKNPGKAGEKRPRSLPQPGKNRE